MAINVIHGVDAVGFDALLYPEQSPFNDAYLRNQLQGFSSTLNDLGRSFMEGAKNVYEQIHNSEAALLARNAIKAAQGLFRPNVIMPLMTLEAMQAAQPTMQRWMMASEEIRKLYHAQRCDGYSESYVDIYPDQIGQSHYDWRRVMTGVITEDGDDLVVRHYPDELVEGDRELAHSEKIDIISTWDLAEMFMSQGFDPTNQFGGGL